MNLDAKFVLSKKKALEQYGMMKDVADIISYSFKTNNEVGKILEENTDCLFSIHYIHSLKNLKEMSRILFFLQAANNDEFDELFRRGINKFIVDNAADLENLLSYIKKNNKKITLFLRMRLKEHTIHTGKHYVYGMFSDTVNRLIPELKKNENISKLGIHFHRKTQNTSEWGIKDEFIESVTMENIKLLDYVNIGGGIPSAYKNFRPEILPGILGKITEFKKFLNGNEIKMIVEPGRFIAAAPVELHARITGIHENTLIINCSVFNSAMDTFIANIRLLVKGELPTGKNYTIKGCTPDSMDIFRYSVFLENLKVGDEIVFINAGAYNFATDLCNMPKLRTEVVE